MNGYNADFDCTPAQYHAVIDRLWNILGVEGVQQHDVFTMIEKEIRELREKVAKFAKFESSDHIMLDAKQVRFDSLVEGNKFATSANKQVVIWTKIYDGQPVYKSGDCDDGYTCPMANAITDCGFPAVLHPEDLVCVVGTERWSKDPRFE